MPSTSAPRAPSSDGRRRVGHRPRVRLRARAAAISSAVRRAVPEGASALSGWCSSTTSTDSKNGAASAAKRIISTAPMEKLGAIRTPTPGASSSQPRSVGEPLVVEAGRADHRVDAVLDAEPQVVHHHVGVGEVDDGLAPRRSPDRRASRRRRRRATSSVSAAASTARHTSAPDLAQRSEHPDLQHLAHDGQPTGRRLARGVTDAGAG